MLSHADLIEADFQQWRERLRRLIWLRGLCWVIAAAFLALLVAGWFDFLARPAQPWLRWTLAGCVWAVVLMTVLRALIGPLTVRLDRAAAARILENLEIHSPGTHSLAAQQARSSSGTPLIEAANRTAADRLRAAPSRKLFRDDAVRAPATWLAMVTLVGLGTVSLAASESWTAIQRLAAPWKDILWPQYDWLVLVDENSVPLPDAIVVDAGEPLQWRVVDERGSPPDELWLLIRRNGRLERQPIELRAVQHPNGLVSRAGLIELIVEEPLSLRVVGGDDRRMQWVNVNVYYPPRVTGFQITTTPPDYADLDPTVNETLSGQFECLVGSQVEVIATFDQPLESAQLIREGFPNEIMELSDDNMKAAAAWVVTSSEHDSYQFEVVDQNLGERSKTRLCEVRAVVDEAPTIVVESPPVSMLVTEAASVPVRFTVEDDIAVSDVAAAYSLTMSADADSYALPTHAERLTDQLLSATGWLEPLAIGAVVGDRISFWAEATDRYDLGPPHIARSEVRTLSIVTQADKLAELHERLDALVAQLRRLHADALRSADALTELKIQAQTAHQLLPSDLELARRLLFDVQILAADVYENEASLLKQATQISEELHWNDLRASELAGQLDVAVGRLSHLGTWAFPELQSGLAAVVERGAASGSQSEIDASILRAWHAQGEIVDALSAILHILGEYRRFGSVGEALAELRKNQTAINADAARAAQTTLGKEWSELSPQQQADLGRLAERQTRIRSTLIELIAELQRRPSVELSSTASETEVEVLRRLARPQLTVWLQEAADLLADNELGQAMPKQQAILDEFAAIEDVLAGRIPQTAASLEDALAALTQTVESTQSLLSQIEQAGNTVDSQQQSAWAELQLQLIASVEAALLEHNASPSPAWVRSGRRAVSRLRQAYAALMESDWAVVQVEQQEAIDDLKQAVEGLRSLIDRDVESRMLEQLQDLPGQLQSLLERQSELLREVRDLDSQYTSSGQWNRELLRRVREAADSQGRLAEDQASVAATTSEWPAIHLALSEEMAWMNQSAQRLEQRDVGEPTQQLQQQAIVRLEQIRDSFHIASAASSDEPSPANADSTSQRAWAATLAEVRVLRDLQEELKTQTADVVDSMMDNAELVISISDRQTRLASAAGSVLSAFLLDKPADIVSESDELNRLAQSALAKIESAALALEQGEFTSATVDLQGEIVALLDRMLELAPVSSPGIASAQTPSHPDEDTSPSAGEGQGADPSAGGASETDSLASEADLEVQRARDRELAIDAWGHLPPRAQQQLQADFPTEFLPEYDEWIRRYYEALAEQR